MMKNKRLAKVWSKRHLPTDLWPQILCKLPVKSLLRFRRVSKSWLFMIDDSEFTRMHLQNFKNNRDETNLLVIQCRQQHCVVRCSNTFKTNSETLLTLGSVSGRWYFICSLDGLIILKSVAKFGQFCPLKMWNPSIRKFHELPSLPEIKISHYRLADRDIGLGYDPLAKDYKHVKLIFVSGKTLHSVAIYSLGAGSWRIIEFQGCNWHWRCEQMFYCKGNVYLDGSLYFTAKDAHNQHAWDLVSFNLSNEMFSCISMPNDPCFNSSTLTNWNTLALIDSGRSLAAFDVSSPNKSVWTLERSDAESGLMCWTKLYSLKQNFHYKENRFLYLTKNGDILLEKSHRDEEVRCRQVVSWNPKTEECKILQQRKGSPYSIGDVHAYVESLILHK